MIKNFILLAMSTLSLYNDENTGKKILPKFEYINDETDTEPKEYYSQLEPVTRRIISKSIPDQIDQIIVLCTKESMQKETFYLEDDLEDELSFSAFDLYKHRISKLLPENKRDIFSSVDIDTSNINVGIINAANLIINKKAEIEKALGKKNEIEIKLWIDTQGGFRDISLVMNAIMNLLKMQKISIGGIYSVQFNRTMNPESVIKEQTENYSIFNFVSGMNEFIMYGRAEQLLHYYTDNSYKCPDAIMNIVKAMRNVADSIQMCDPKGFLCYLTRLRGAISDYERQEAINSQELFTVFINEVKNDYGVLLSNEECANIDIIDWFHRKQFYQQALTFIESKIPLELCGKKLINFEYNKENISKFKKIDKKKYEDDENYLLFQFVFMKYVPNNIVHRIFSQQGDSHEIIIEEILKICDNMRFLCNNERTENTFEKEKEVFIGKIVYSDKLKMVLNEVIMDDINLFRCFLFLFSALKKERNNFNHMSDKEGNRATKGELDKAILTFIELGRRLYKLIKKD